MYRYVIVPWPESQKLMLEDWFSECILVPSEYQNDWIWSSAYFVPEDRFFENDYEAASNFIFYVDKSGNIIDIEIPT